MYGFRSKTTMRNDRTWYEANAFAALSLLLTPLARAGMRHGDLSLVAGIFQVGPLLVMALLLMRYDARRRE